MEHFCKYLSICYPERAPPHTEPRTPAKTVSRTSTGLRLSSVTGSALVLRAKSQSFVRPSNDSVEVPGRPTGVPRQVLPWPPAAWLKR